MHCPDQNCQSDGYTLVVQDCHFHGSYSASLYKHIGGVSVDEQPVVAFASSGTLFGGHEFYDDLHEIVHFLVQELGVV